MSSILTRGARPAAPPHGSFLSKERIIAAPGFNRWRVPPAALAIPLCIGMAHGFPVFWLPLSKALGGPLHRFWMMLLGSGFIGGFATVPADLADLFGTQMVGAIQGRFGRPAGGAGLGRRRHSSGLGRLPHRAQRHQVLPLMAPSFDAFRSLPS